MSGPPPQLVCRRRSCLAEAVGIAAGARCCLSARPCTTNRRTAWCPRACHSAGMGVPAARSSPARASPPLATPGWTRTASQLESATRYPPHGDLCLVALFWGGGGGGGGGGRERREREREREREERDREHHLAELPPRSRSAVSKGPRRLRSARRLPRSRFPSTVDAERGIEEHPAARRPLYPGRAAAALARWRRRAPSPAGLVVT